jgi:hypothetical protein
MAKLWSDTVSGDDLRQAQASIDDAMAGARADARRSNPNAVQPVAKVGPKGTGWVDPRPLALPPGQRPIERLVNAALPHGPEHGRKR